MKLMKTFVLFIILALLGSYVYFYEIKGGEEREKVEQLEKKVIVFEKDSVKTIEIRSAFRQFLFEDSEDEWRINKPVNTDGEKSTIDGILSTLQNLTKQREFTIRKDDLTNYGLVGRSTLVILIFNDGKRDSVRFGDNTPVGSNVFANREDTVVYMVPEHAKNTVSKDIFHWRDKSIAKIKQSDVREFNLKNSKGKFNIIKVGSEWQIKSPKDVQADNSTINSILRKIESEKVKSVVSESMDDTRKYRLANPTYEIILFLGTSKASKKLTFSSVKDNVSNGKDESRPHVFTVDSLFIKEIDKYLFYLRYKKIAEYNKDIVDSVLVYQGDSLLTVVKDTSDNWFLGVDKKVKTWKMNSFLNSFKNLTAKKFLLENVSATKKYGLAKPVRKIGIFSNGKKIQELLFGAERDDNRVTFCPTTKIVAEVTSFDYNNLEIDPSQFLEEKKEEVEETN